MAQEPSSSPASPDAPSRREFVKRGVVAAALPVLAPLAACTATVRPDPAPEPAANPSVPPAASAQPVAPSAPPQQPNERQRDPVAEQLTDALKARYRDRLTDAQCDEVRRGVEGNLGAARALHDFSLPMQTEPAFVFRAYRGGER
jgi:hypothetical protein